MVKLLTSNMRLRNWIKNNIYRRKSILDPTKNYSELPKKLVRKFSKKKILNIGSGDEPLGKNVITLDLSSHADIKADALFLPIKSQSVDLVLCIAVLEHLKNPQKAINQMHRVLKNGGEVYLEIPFLQPFHESPNDFYRATLPGLKNWCEGFDELDSGVCVGPGSAVAWLEIEYIKLVFGNIPIIGLLAEIGFRLWSLPLKYIDKLLVNKIESHKTASAIYFYGKKP